MIETDSDLTNVKVTVKGQVKLFKSACMHGNDRNCLRASRYNRFAGTEGFYN